MTLKLNFALVKSFVLLWLFHFGQVNKIGGVHFRLLGTKGFYAKAKTGTFTAASLRCRQNLKCENFTSSFGRLRQNIAPKSVPHVQHDYFSSLNQSNHWFVALPLTLLPSNLKLPKVLTTTSTHKSKSFILYIYFNHASNSPCAVFSVNNIGYGERSNNRKVVTMSQMFILKWRFCCRCCRCCLSSLSPVSQLSGRTRTLEDLKTMKNVRAACMKEAGKWWEGHREITKTRQCLNKHTLFLCRVFFWSTYP